MVTVHEATDQFVWKKNLRQRGDKMITKWIINAYNNTNKHILL